jgi:1-acyl-sn-glycerol-3-phosphate acyltransferase
MLKANKSVWFERMFAIYNRHLLKRRFNSFRISGLDFLKNKSEALPSIIYANHSSWWDGLVFLEILRRFDSENYVMMEEKQLRKLFFFRWLGAFSVVRQNPRSAVKSINYAAHLLLENSTRTLLIFPQAEILPNDVRPLRFYKGLARVIEKVQKCRAIPVALRFEFAGNFKPEIYVKIGEPEIINIKGPYDAKSSTKKYETRLTETLENLKRDVMAHRTDGYDKIF